jgi:SSS family solute:Na+ symporter
MMWWLVVLGVVSGLVSVYGGMASMAYTSVLQFVLIFGSGAVLFGLAYQKLPNGWSDVVAHAPGGFHLIQPADYPEIPWQAIPLTLLSLHLYYSCINQAMVQRGFGGRTEWDARMAIIAAGFAVFFRPFVEVYPGMMARALAYSGYSEYDLGVTRGASFQEMDVDSLLPMLVNNLVRPGFIGLMIVGILSSVMSTITAFLGSISTLFAFDVYKKWIRPDATEKDMVRVGVMATIVLMFFGIFYSPLIGQFGVIFKYFQTMAAYVAAPIATVYLFGVFWKRTTSAAAFAIMLGGIPLSFAVHIAIPRIFTSDVVASYSLNNQFVEAGICQFICAGLLLLISLATRPRPYEEIEPLLWKPEYLRLPAGEPKRPFFASVPFWWTVFAVFYGAVISYLW